MKGLVSVILPVYNAAIYLNDSIDSILEQSYIFFELIIINDGSTDSSLDIINSYNDDRIKLINNPENLGLISTLNIGLNLAKGEYIARMDADDISALSRFEKQIEYFKNNPNTDILGTAYETFGFEKKIVNVPEESKEIEIAIYFKNVICHPSIMIKAQSINKYGLKYNPDYLHNEDWAFWISCLQKGLTLNNINEPLLKYRLEGQNITIKNVETANKRYLHLFKNFLPFIIGQKMNNDELNMHLLISRPITINYSSKEILNYINLIRTRFLVIGCDKKTINKILKEKTIQIFYKIADTSKLKAFWFLVKAKQFSIIHLRYLIG